MLRQDDFQRSLLVLEGWKYGHIYGGYLGSCMILSCLANRQKLGWGHWLDIIKDIPRYSATLEQPTGMPSIWEPNFVRLLNEIEIIYDSSKDYAKGGLYWADLSKPVDNEWFVNKILKQPELHPRVCDMNSLTIFR